MNTMKKNIFQKEVEGTAPGKEGKSMHRYAIRDEQI
jgi:hypothetical protein